MAPAPSTPAPAKPARPLARVAREEPVYAPALPMARASASTVRHLVQVSLAAVPVPTVHLGACVRLARAVG